LRFRVSESIVGKIPILMTKITSFDG
jgi:hypothetical protein